MNVMSLLFSTAASFLFLWVIFWPIEKLFPANKEQRLLRPEWWTDVFFFLGQYLLWGSLMLWALTYFSTRIADFMPTQIREIVASLPLWAQILCVLFLSDLSIYWGHRIQHRIPLLWRFHAVHHSAEHLDWLAAHREHPIDTIYTMGIINLPVFLLGFPIEALAGIIAFRGLWAIYIHSNVRLPIGPLRILIGAPELHHWHHDRDRHAGNYANISPLMDWLFGTYKCPNKEPDSFGIHEPIPRSYLGQLIYPFLTKKQRAHRTKKK